MAINKLEETRKFVEQWRKDNGVGSNVTPSTKDVPYKWMWPYLPRVSAPNKESLKIGTA